MLQSARLPQRADRLLRVKRIAGCQLPRGIEYGAINRLVTEQPGYHELAVVSPEPLKLEPDTKSLTAEICQELPKRIAGRGLLRAEHRQEQLRTVLRRSNEVVKQLEAFLIGGVQIIEYHNQRPARCDSGGKSGNGGQ